MGAAMKGAKPLDKAATAHDPSSSTRKATRPVATGALENPPGVTGVQEAAGNLAIQRLFGTGLFQAKLAISQPNDPSEHEADRIAAQVVSGDSLSSVQRSSGRIAGNHGREPGNNVFAKELSDHTNRVARHAEFSPGAVRGGGQPLAPSVRALFEPRFGEDFSGVRVHTSEAAADAAGSIHARAFTTGADIVFGKNQYRPESREGQRLLAHELTHTLQQRDSGLTMIQGDFESDFAGKRDVPVEPNTPRPAGTVRVEAYATQVEPSRWVYAPYGIYSPREIPEAWQDRIMVSTKASDWRTYGIEKTDAVIAQEMERLENRPELTVRDMLRLAEGPGSAMNIRVIIAKVGNDFRFIGYDMSHVQGGVVTGGFVESEEGTTRGVGRLLFADRVVRAISNGATGMHLEVYHSQRTADFHARIFAITGRQGIPTEGTKYLLTPREMIRVALAWSEALTPGQWFELNAVASAKEEPTGLQAQAALYRGTAVRLSGTQQVPSSTTVTGVIDTTRRSQTPSGGAPSGGAKSVSEPPMPVEYTSAIGRLQRLLNARETLQLWRPVVDSQGNDQKRAMDEEFSRLDKSISELGARLTATNDAMAQLRSKSASATAASGRQAAYETSIKSLTAVTASETSIGEQGFRVLEELRQRSIEQVPIQVALGEAFRTGRYSDQAFRFMLSQIDPAARDSILYGPRGGMRPRDVQFQRLTAYYGFGSRVMPSGHTVSLSGMSGGRLAATRVTGTVLLLAEAANLASQAYQSYKLSQQTMRRKNLYPFIRRLLFWDRLGAHPAVVGVDDDFFQWSPDYERDYDTAVKGLEEWDAFFIEDTPERPCLSDMDILSIGAHLAYSVRNYDEFATLFLSSAQDAVKWVSHPALGWPGAWWYVRVGEYDTDWQNSVQERWVYHDKLTKLMNVMSARIIANTEELLRLQAQGKALPGEDSRLGGFGANPPPAGAKTARLRDNAETTTVYTERMRGDQSRDQGTRMPRKVTWWSPPVFYVHKYKHMGFVTVSGADYNTYAVLRRTWYEVWYESAGPSGTTTVEQLAENSEATVEIPWLLLDIDK